LCQAVSKLYRNGHLKGLEYSYAFAIDILKEIQKTEIQDHIFLIRGFRFAFHADNKLFNKYVKQLESHDKAGHQKKVWEEAAKMMKTINRSDKKCQETLLR